MAGQRLQAVTSAILNLKPGIFDIKTKIWGEKSPLNSNGTEYGRAKNRRVDILYWPIKNGRITITGNGGAQFELDKSYFEPCGVCASTPQITEIYTNDEAERAGIPMFTEDGFELETIGMFKFNASCEQGDIAKCKDMVITFSPWMFDCRFKLWTFDRAWYPADNAYLRYDSVEKMIYITVRNCGNEKINLDRPKPKNGIIKFPKLIRSSNSRSYSKSIEQNCYDDTIHHNNGFDSVFYYFLNYNSVYVFDSGIDKKHIGYCYRGTVNQFTVPADSIKSKIERNKYKWLMRVPLAAYKKIIYFYKKRMLLLKVPKKYEIYGIVLFIPDTDTVLQVEKSELGENTYIFKHPKPFTYIAFTKDSLDKTSIVAKINLSKIRKRYKKSEKLYYLKIKKRHIRKAFRKNQRI